MNEKMVIIDDEEDMLENCKRILGRLGYDVVTYSDSMRALEMLRVDQPAIVLTDLRMPKKDGMEVLRAVKEFDPATIVLLFTAYATVQSAVEAIRNGASDYITKPFSREQLRLVIERALRQKQLTEENRQLRHQLNEVYGMERIVGNSEPIRKIFRVVGKAARTEASILILGESGTGKELVARSLWSMSLRDDSSFVPVDCASLPESLLESELFGHEKGAFTGAQFSKPGIFELAHQGTLFLDEIGELSLNLQVKLLRVLQEGQLRRIGGTSLIPVDFRLITATNRDLEEAVANKTFREDLFYRINVITIHIPPLRDRGEDILLLAQHFLQKYCEKYHKQVAGLSHGVLDLLAGYAWPGNVRELQNVIERAVVLSEGEVIGPGDLPEHVRGTKKRIFPAPAPGGSFSEAKQKWNAQFEQEYLRSLLARHGGNVSRAAREAQVARKTIYRLLEKYRIEVDESELDSAE